MEPIKRCINESWNCERCNKHNKVFKVLSRIYDYSMLHKCKCNKLKVLVSK